MDSGFSGSDNIDNDAVSDVVNDAPNDVVNDKPFDDEPFEAGVEADEESDPEKFIQQLAGKLGQSLRKFTDGQGGPDFDLEKFAINSVISATHSSEMDQEDQKDIINKIKNSGAINGHEHDDEEETYDHDHDSEDGYDEKEGGEAPEGEEDIEMEENIIHEDDMQDESFDPYNRPSEDDTMDLINKYNPTLVKIGKDLGQDSDTYRRFSDALSRGDEDFVLKLMKDSGVVMESVKNSGLDLVNSKKTHTFVNKLRDKLLEHEDMKTFELTAPVETPTITPTKTPTRVPRRGKPFKTPIIKPGTQPNPKASN